MCAKLLTPPDGLARDLAAIDGAKIDRDTTFAELTTLRLGGSPIATVRCRTRQALADAVALLDAAGVPALVVGGGSNLVVADGDVGCVAVVAECAEVTVDAARGRVIAEAGAVFDDVVAQTVAAGLGGLECLSGIPGSIGATPVQNVGAYGAEIAEVLSGVQLFDRRSGSASWVEPEALELSYRYSNLKFTQRAVVLAVELRLSADGLSAPLRFGALASALGATGADQRFPAADVRREVLRLRAGKGMVLDEADHDTWSAGSFFTNPIVSPALAQQVCDAVRATLGGAEADRMPRYPAGEQVKLSAAWLIERAGFPRGFPGQGAPVRLSTKHTLALTNRGGATTQDLVELARRVRDGVRTAFGVELRPEPVWVGVGIDAAG